MLQNRIITQYRTRSDLGRKQAFSLYYGHLQQTWPYSYCMELQNMLKILVLVVKGEPEEVLLKLFQIILTTIDRLYETEAIPNNSTKWSWCQSPGKTNWTIWNSYCYTINGITVPFATEVKYFGINLDKKLNWISQDNPQNKYSTVGIPQICGKCWGMSLKQIYCLYVKVIFLLITYGVVVRWIKGQQWLILAKQVCRDRLVGQFYD